MLSLLSDGSLWNLCGLFGILRAWFALPSFPVRFVFYTYTKAFEVTADSCECVAGVESESCCSSKKKCTKFHGAECWVAEQKFQVPSALIVFGECDCAMYESFEGANAPSSSHLSWATRV